MIINSTNTCKAIDTSDNSPFLLLHPSCIQAIYLVSRSKRAVNPSLYSISQLLHLSFAQTFPKFSVLKHLSSYRYVIWLSTFVTACLLQSSTFLSNPYHLSNCHYVIKLFIPLLRHLSSVQTLSLLSRSQTLSIYQHLNTVRAVPEYGHVHASAVYSYLLY